MFGHKWQLVLVTTAEMGDADGSHAAGATVPIGGRSLLVLSHA
jgi:hypothetical protein